MRRQEELKEASSPLVTLTVAWTVVVGLAFAPVGMYYYQTGNLRVLLAFTAAAFVIGLSLFIAMGLGRAGARAKTRRRRGAAEGPAIADVRKRGAIFGKR
jgi:hypothetical protein